MKSVIINSSDKADRPLVIIANSTSSYVFKFRLAIITALQDLGYRIAVLAPRDEYSIKLEQLGCEFHCIELDGKSTNPVKELLLLCRLYKMYRDLSPNLILHFTPKPNIYGSFAARMLRIPVINNISGLGSGFVRGGFLQKIVIGLYKYSQRNAERVFFQNKDDMALFLGKGIVETAKCELLPGSGVDLDEFPFSQLPKQKEMTFIFVGRLIRDKGVIEYLSAAQKLLEMGISARFKLVGGIAPSNPSSLNTDDISKWEEMEGVSFVGEVEDVRPYLRGAHCVVLPSYREGTPRSLLEAASMGRILIAADSVGTREPVEDGVNGFLCRVESADDLARIMLKVSELSKDELLAMSEASRKIVEIRYNIDHVVQLYKQAVIGIIDKHS